MQKALGYLRLIRPVNCLMMGIAVLVGVVLAGAHALDEWQNLAFGFITGFTLAAASMVLNDYLDQEIDAVNEPDRPIPSGLVKSCEAVTLGSVLTVAGLLAAFLSSILCLLLAALSMVVFTIYSTVGKRRGLFGNLLVSVCVALPFIYGNALAANSIQLNALIFGSMAFLSNTGREITKGIVDARGDKMKDVMTLAVQYGNRTASIAAVIFYLLAVALSPVPWFLGLVSLWFLVFVVVADLGFVVSSYRLLRNRTRETARLVKNLALLWSATGLVAFVTGALL